MSVASRNPFALLSEDGEAPAAVPAPVKKNDTTSAVSKPTREIPGAVRRGGAARDGARGGPRGAITAAADGEQRENRDSRLSERGRAGRGRGRGGRGRGREFDRHSATGRTDSGKAIAQGWGGDDPKREQDAEEGAVLDAVAEESSVATPANGETKADGAEAAAADAGAPAAVEEVDNTKTLDEYLAEQATKKAAINGTKAPTPRQADEWKEFGTKVQKASEDSESYFAATASSKESARAQKARKEKQAVEIDTYFEAPASGERGVRGGRGGSRGGAGRGRGSDRGSGRGGATRGSRGGPGGASGRSARGQANFSLDDSRAFPSLSA